GGGWRECKWQKRTVLPCPNGHQGLSVLGNACLAGLPLKIRLASPCENEPRQSLDRSAFRGRAQERAHCRSHRLIGGDCRLDIDAPAFLVEIDLAFHERKDRVVTPQAHIATGMPFRSTLANDDVPRNDGLAAKFLDPQPLRAGIAAVAGRSLSL